MAARVDFPQFSDRDGARREVQLEPREHVVDTGASRTVLGSDFVDQWEIKYSDTEQSQPSGDFAGEPVPMRSILGYLMLRHERAKPIYRTTPYSVFLVEFGLPESLVKRNTGQRARRTDTLLGMDILWDLMRGGVRIEEDRRGREHYKNMIFDIRPNCLQRSSTLRFSTDFPHVDWALATLQRERVQHYFRSLTRPA